jgi:hypothetical protein
VQNTDWEVVEKIQDKWIEESMYLKRNLAHSWYWMSSQTKDDVTAFTVWDSNCHADLNGELSSLLAA